MRLLPWTLTCTCMVLVVRAQVSSVPLLVWSSQQHFTNSDADWEVPAVVDVQDVAEILLHLGTVGLQPDSNALLEYVVEPSSPSRPEVLVSFVFQKESSASALQEAGAFSGTQAPVFEFLQRALRAAKSSLVVPFLRTNNQAISQVLSSALASANGTTVKLEGGTCEAILSGLASHDAIFHNGATDLLLIQPHSLDGACMDRILTAVTSLSRPGHMLALFTADSTGAPPVVTTFVGEEVGRLAQRRLLASAAMNASTTTIVGIQYVNAPILAGLALSFLMLIFLWVGVSCLMSIQAPVRFASQALPVPKEY